MKKLSFILIMLVVLITTSCADSKKITVKDSNNNTTVITVKPYGWANSNTKVEGIEYQVCVGNVVWDVILGETIIVPVVLTGWSLFEPVGLKNPEIIIENDILKKQ